MHDCFLVAFRVITNLLTRVLIMMGMPGIKRLTAFPKPPSVPGPVKNDKFSWSTIGDYFPNIRGVDREFSLQPLG